MSEKSHYRYPLGGDGQRVISTAMIPPPATERPKPPPPDSGSPRRFDPPMVAYDLPLRPDLLVRLVLPRDLTPADAERLCGVIRSLPFPPSNEGDQTA